MDSNKDNLENALNADSSAQGQEMPKEMEIGFHQGALNTLSAERAELLKIVQNVEKIMSMHIQRLEQLGVKIQKSE